MTKYRHNKYEIETENMLVTYDNQGAMTKVQPLVPGKLVALDPDTRIEECVIRQVSESLCENGDWARFEIDLITGKWKMSVSASRQLSLFDEDGKPIERKPCLQVIP